jgi:TM2 domain-containing membrane protein YozV
MDVFRTSTIIQKGFFIMPKSRLAYILLGIFLGSWGIHNFYAGYTNKAIIQLLISVISCGILTWVSFIWAIVDIVTVTTDANGVRMIES